MYSHWKIRSIERAFKVTLIQFNLEAKSPAAVAVAWALDLPDTSTALVFITVCLFHTANSRWQGSGLKPAGNLVPRDLSNSRGRVEEGPRNQLGKSEVRPRLRAVRELHHVSIARNNFWGSSNARLSSSISDIAWHGVRLHSIAKPNPE